MVQRQAVLAQGDDEAELVGMVALGHALAHSQGKRRYEQRSWAHAAAARSAKKLKAEQARGVQDPFKPLAPIGVWVLFHGWRWVLPVSTGRSLPRHPDSRSALPRRPMTWHRALSSRRNRRHHGPKKRRPKAEF